MAAEGVPSLSTSLIDIGKLSKPATVLIKKISGAIGTLFAPTHIRRIAKAEVDAAIIKAAGQIQLTTLQERAWDRMLHEGTVHQTNIEQITLLALPDLASDSNPEEIDTDWLVNFFDRGRLVSDAEMQSLWARLLAGEANKPGAFSRRTVGLVANFDRNDAGLFTALCGFAWTTGDISPVVFEHQLEIYTKAGVNFGMLTHLEAIGLVRFESLTGFAYEKLPKEILNLYFDRRAFVEFDADADNRLEVGHVLFTAAGRELASIAGAKPVEGLFEYVCETWRSQGYKVTAMPQTQDLETKE